MTIYLPSHGRNRSSRTDTTSASVGTDEMTPEPSNTA